MDQQAFTKAEITREQAADLAADPLELIKLLGSSQAKVARNAAEVQEATQLSNALISAHREPLPFAIPPDWDQPDRQSFAILHHGVDSVDIAAAGKPKRSNATKFGAPAADSKGIVRNTTAQDDWSAPAGFGMLSNLYLGVALQSKSTGQHVSINITVGVQFIDPDLFDGEFTAAPLIEAVERGMITVIPPGVPFKLNMLSKPVRERMAIGALQFCNDASDLKWHADLLSGSEIAKHINRKIKTLEE